MKEPKFRIGGIIQKRDLARIGIMGIPDRPGVAGAIFSALGSKGINCPFIVHTIDLNNQDSIALCVAQSQLTEALKALASASSSVGAKEVVHTGEVAMIAVFGPHFGERPGVAGVMFSALASADINILAISTSISSLSCIIDAAQLDEAMQALQEAFERPRARS
jgi:aspartokinase